MADEPRHPWRWSATAAVACIAIGSTWSLAAGGAETPIAGSAMAPGTSSVSSTTAPAGSTSATAAIPSTSTAPSIPPTTVAPAPPTTEPVPAATVPPTTAPPTAAAPSTTPPTITAPSLSTTAGLAEAAAIAAPSGWAGVTTVGAGVVNIKTRLPNGFGAGTGMVLTVNGLVLTNNHVIKGATTVQVTIAMTGKTYAASVVGSDPAHDIAVLQLVSATGLTPIPLGNSDRVRRGDAVAALGNAGGQGGRPVVTLGTVLGLDHDITATDVDGNNAEVLAGLIQIQAQVLPGDSGGPLADASGHVIGLNTAASTSGGEGAAPVEHKGYAIPINAALRIASSLVGHRLG